MASKKSDMKAKVEARRKSEEETRKLTAGGKKADIDNISDRDLCSYVKANRLGDAQLYCRLFRGKVVFVKYWERFLIWGGNHWIEEDYDEAKANIKQVCDIYLQYADRLQNKLESTKSKSEQANIQNLINTITRKVDQLRNITGQDQLLEMLKRVKPPLTVLPKHIDKQHYLKACPNGVIDSRTGELRSGQPEQYILNSIVTEYDPALLEIDDPCPETRTHFIIND